MTRPTTLRGTLEGIVRGFVTPRVPTAISQNFRPLTKPSLDLIEASLSQNYFAANHVYLSSAVGKTDLQDHLVRRLDEFRRTVIPWLNSTKSLQGATILEIGCGTGSSTIALAEQGARVTAIDILDTSLAVARDRCRVYGLQAEFFDMNATKVNEAFAGQHFDFIIFFAALEHMTHDERMIAMNRTWNMLSKDDLWCVIDTPNRLWFLDGHTSLLPFFHWLPDELAFGYSRFSPREGLREQCREMSGDAMRHFLRWGRGVSYHEFELAMDRLEALDVVSSLPIFLRKQDIWRELLWRLAIESRYTSFLASVAPKVHRGFYEASLDLIIRKG